MIVGDNSVTIVVRVTPEKKSESVLSRLEQCATCEFTVASAEGAAGALLWFAQSANCAVSCVSDRDSRCTSLTSRSSSTRPGFKQEIPEDVVKWQLNLLGD